MTQIRGADCLVTEMPSDSHHLASELVGSGGGHEQRVPASEVDCRPEVDLGGAERCFIECRRHLVGVCVADEPQGDVPVLGNHKSSSDLVFAVELFEVGDHVLGRPQCNEQTTHTHILAVMIDLHAFFASARQPTWGSSGVAVGLEVGVAVAVAVGAEVWNSPSTRQHWGAMSLTIGSRPDPAAALQRLHTVLATIPARVVACSGGVDSLLLATVAHRASSAATLVAHTVTPAVPDEGTTRVVDYADREGWRLEIVRSSEFDDERYLANPTDRCYYCKSNLYDAIAELSGGPDASKSAGDGDGDGVMLSGANVDDLGEYRPGLTAAAERNVRHPYIEAGITKAEIRAIARHLELDAADLPASPCLASRLYTGTRVTAPRLRAIEAGEQLIRSTTSIAVVRCRLRGNAVMVEVGDGDRHLIDDALLTSLKEQMAAIESSIVSVELDGRAYEPGRAFVGAPVV